MESTEEAATPGEEVLGGRRDRPVELRVRSVNRFSGGACSRSPCVSLSISPNGSRRLIFSIYSIYGYPSKR